MEENSQSPQNNINHNPTFDGPSSNINSSDIDEELPEKLRGDTIGDTMYSESFVVRTLLGISNGEWSDTVEDDLCFIWDMTLDKDVCNYLVGLNYPSIACDAIYSIDEPRLIEIMIGILANICCKSDTTIISDLQIEIILMHLKTNDSMILIQVVRFLEALAHDRKSLPFINSSTSTQLNYILSNSCNSDLLMSTLNLVVKVTEVTGDNIKVDVDLINGSLLESTVIAYRYILNNDEELEEKKRKKVFTHFIRIMYNICSLMELSSDKVQLGIEPVMEEILKVFQYYEEEEDGFSKLEELRFYCENLTFVFQVLHVKYNSELVRFLLSILKVALELNYKEIDSFLELFCYFIAVGCLTELKSDLKCITDQYVCTILKKIVDSSDVISINPVYKDNLSLLIEYK